MAAEPGVIAADRTVAHQRHRGPQPGRIQHIGLEALPLRVGDSAAIQQHLPRIEGDADAAGLELGRVAQQLVHLRPQPLLLGE